MSKVLNGAAVALTALLLVGVTVISVLGSLDPLSASVKFGMPLNDDAGALFYRVFASRNVVIALAGAAFLALGERRAIAILVSLMSLLALFDMAVLYHAGVSPPSLHLITFIVIVITAILLWRRAATKGQ